MIQTKLFTRTRSFIFSLIMIGLLGLQGNAFAVGEDRASIDWNKLGLTDEQNKQIRQLESDWEKHYGELKGGLTEDQNRLAKLLGIHSSDPVEIMALQDLISHKREQLNGIAMTTYLKKREVLTDNQQHTLELMMKQAVAQKHAGGAGGETEVMPDHIQGLMQRVRNIWPVQGEP